jgi:hypothetical protein
VQLFAFEWMSEYKLGSNGSACSMRDRQADPGALASYAEVVRAVPAAAPREVEVPPQVKHAILRGGKVTRRWLGDRDPSHAGPSRRLDRGHVAARSSALTTHILAPS